VLCSHERALVAGQQVDAGSDVADHHIVEGSKVPVPAQPHVLVEPNVTAGAEAAPSAES